MPENDYRNLIATLKGSLGETRVITEIAKRFAYGTCAAFYHATPEIVVYANSESDIIKTLSTCQQHRVLWLPRQRHQRLREKHYRFGLGPSPGEMAGLRNPDQGRSITLGVLNTGGEANQALQIYGRKIGPDPASIQTASIGGIVSNNSSGMTFGTNV
jgi:D-lactate dehydrogenase